MIYDPSNMIEEAQKAEESRDMFLACLDAMHERMHGSAYRSDKDVKSSPDNHEHDFVTHVLPQVAFANPRITAKGRSGDLSRQIAKAMKYGLQRWVEDQKFFEINQQVCLDALFAYGIFITTNEPADWERANDYESVHLPVVRRLDPRQFLLDPLCSDYRYARWLGHDTVWDLEELKAIAEDPESGWDAGLVGLLGMGSEEVEWRDKRLRDNAPDRNECVIRELWCPGSYLDGFGPEEGYHGTIYTVGRGQADLGSVAAKDSWLRQPRPYWGPPWGMYTIAGVYRVPGIPFPLGPLTVQKPCADDLNEIGREIDRGVREYKRVTMMDAANADAIAKRKAAKNGDVIAVRGFNRNEIEQTESGGISAEMVAIYNQRQMRLNRVASMSETLRGNADASKTATAESIAAQSNEVIVGWIRERAYKAAAQVVDTAGWYLYNDPRARIELGEDAAAELGMQNPTFYGDPQGMIGEQLGLNGPAPIGEYRDVVEVGIEADSMNMVTSAMQRQQGLEMLGTTLPLLQQMPTMPWIPWKDIGGYLADLYNDDRIREWFKPDIAAQFAGMPGAIPATPQMQYAGSGSTTPQKQPKQPANAMMPGMTGPLSLSNGGFMAQNRPMEGKVAWNLAKGAA